MLMQTARQRTSVSLMAVVGVSPVSGAGGSALLQGQLTYKGFCEECVASRSNASCWRAVFTGCQSVWRLYNYGTYVADPEDVLSSLSCPGTRYGQGAGLGLESVHWIAQQKHHPDQPICERWWWPHWCTHIPRGVLSVSCAIPWVGREPQNPDLIYLYEDCLFLFWISWSEE